ncbi:TetR family transcriptional regulator [Nakamurella aerolata]|uniref:TetR/AcrR family transcriptional regulator n=1 Tax=Nakamurella aerolata TaxID=1656892 RepID=A0A849ABF3_9ACTN|nr:TetR/AcrR family transcriptional regulator [Nakamurella aerolata]
MPPSHRSRLTRADWIAGAANMIAERGVAALAVEPLAVRLGTTKGSFYWHFTDRAALLDAVLADWVERATADVIVEIESGAGSDPVAGPDSGTVAGGDSDADNDRLAALLAVALADRAVVPALEWALLSAVDDAQVAPAVARVHRMRIDYLRELFSRRGLPQRRAEARARICYAAYLGTLQLRIGSGADSGAEAGSKVLAGKEYRAELLRMLAAD